jgi:carboxyl-terminal processing protease
LLSAAVDVADLFLDRGVIVITHGRAKTEDSTYSAREPGTWRVPLVLLIDQESASAAEILAGAIHDHRRGVVVGQRSFGKGTVQSIIQLRTLDDAGPRIGLRLTTAKFFSPLGKPYSGAGVEPDVLLRQSAKPAAGGLVSPERDAALAAALRAAEQAVATQQPLAQRN